MYWKMRVNQANLEFERERADLWTQPSTASDVCCKGKRLRTSRFDRVFDSSGPTRADHGRANRQQGHGKGRPRPNALSGNAVAADLQLVAAVPVARYVEYLTPTPYIDELIMVPFKPDAEGFLRIPEKPGLGVELNRETLKRYGLELSTKRLLSRLPELARQLVPLQRAVRPALRDTC